jgi:hypothetical protein
MNAQTQLPNTLPYTTVVKTCTLSLQLQTVMHTHTSTDLRFKTPVRTLKVEAAAWLKGGSHVCDQCTGGDEHVPNEVHGLLFCQDHQGLWAEENFLLLFTPFIEDLSTARPYLLQQVNSRLVHNFLTQQNTTLVSSLSKLMNLWPAETSQQPISQTTWLKVNPHCNHCNHLHRWGAQWKKRGNYT